MGPRLLRNISVIVSLFNIAVITLTVPTTATLWILSPVVRSGSEPLPLILVLIAVLLTMAAEIQNLVRGNGLALNVLLRAGAVALLCSAVSVAAPSVPAILSLLGVLSVHAFQIHAFAQRRN